MTEILELSGELLHAFFNAGPEDAETWIMTKKDTRAMAPPATRIANRYDVLRAAAAAGDEALLAAALARYATRNYVKRRRMLAQHQEQGPQPITGVEAPEGSGPESDEEWQRQQDPFTMAPPAITPKGPRSR